MTPLKAGLVIPVQYKVDPASDLLIDIASGSAVGYPVYTSGVIVGWLDDSGNVLVGEPSSAGGISGGGFGGYDPNMPPAGYDPICWRAVSWDRERGLTCLVGADGRTTLGMDLSKWTPWTTDLGQVPPPPDSAYAWCVAQGICLPHPGPLTLSQAQTLLAAVQANPNMSAVEFTILVNQLRGSTPVTPVNLDKPPTIQGALPPEPTQSGISAPTSVAPPAPLTLTPVVGITSTEFSEGPPPTNTQGQTPAEALGLGTTTGGGTPGTTLGGGTPGGTAGGGGVSTGGTTGPSATAGTSTTVQGMSVTQQMLRQWLPLAAVAVLVIWAALKGRDT